MTGGAAAPRVWPVPDRLAANGALCGAAFLWGSFFPVVADLLGTWDPYTLTVVRLALGAVILVGLVLAIDGRRAYAASLPWRRIVLLGFVGFALFCILITFGILYSGAISASLVSSTSPILAAFLVWGFAGRKPSRVVVLAALLAVAGGMIVVFRDGPAELRGGELFVLGSTAAFIWYTFKVPDWLSGLSPLAITAHTVGAGALCLIPPYAVAVWAGWIVPKVELSARSFVLLFYLAATSVALAAALWNYGIKRIKVEVASMYSNMCPVFAVMVSMFMGVYPSWAHLIGGVMILVAIIWVQSTRGAHGDGLRS
ncbi:MAG: DMT family transporter [Alphaproteobacteria bacterium]